MNENYQKSFFVRFNTGNSFDEYIYNEIQEYVKITGLNVNDLIKNLLFEMVQYINENDDIYQVLRNLCRNPKEIPIIDTTYSIKEVEPEPKKDYYNDEIVSSNKFIKGQVWYWKDSTYGKKDWNKNVKYGEGTLRYNRFVIIIQDPSTMGKNNTLLCIPMSSHSNDPYDVCTSAIPEYNIEESFARTRMISPININMLEKYIFTISSKELLLINYRLAQIFLANHLFNKVDEAIKELITLPPLIDVTVKEYLPEEKECEVEENTQEEVEQICDKVIEETVEEPIQEMKIESVRNSFDLYHNIILYTIAHKEITIIEISQYFNIAYNTASKYVDMLTKDKIISRKYKNKPRKVLINSIFSLGTKFSSEEFLKVASIIISKKFNKEEIDLSLLISIKKKSSINTKKWTKEYIEEFLEFYNSNGCTETSNKYNMPAKSIYNTVYMMKKKLGENNIWKEKKFINSEKSVLEEYLEKYPNLEYTLISVISDFGNYNRYINSCNNTFDKYYLKRKKGSDKVKESAFLYNKISLYIYKSLIELLMIEVNDSNISRSTLKNVDEIFSKYKNTIDFLLDFYEINKENNKNYIYYNIPETGNIDKEWYGVLYKYLSSGLHQKYYSTISLTGDIINTYCNRE